MVQEQVLEVVVVVIKRTLLLLCVLVMLQKNALARTQFELLNNMMIQDGDGGRQVADESGNQHLMIYEPVIFIDSKIGHNTTIFGTALVDFWTSASEGIFDTSTGASGRGLLKFQSTDDDDDDGTGATTSSSSPLQNRKSVSLGVSQKYNTWTFTPTISYSTEFDYSSINGGLTVDKSFAEDNFILSLGYHFFNDRSHPFDVASSSFADWQAKYTHTFNVSASQLLSESDLILLGYNLTMQSGFLGGGQNSVLLNNNRVSEVLPTARNRHAAVMRYVHGFSDTLSAHLDYRFYLDNWGIVANTLEPSLYLGFSEDTGLVKFFYRIHRQSAANYYQDSFPTARTYMTSDSDLAKFTAHEAGTTISKKWDIKNLFLKSVGVNATGVYYWRSNDLRAQIYQVGITGEF